MNKLTDYVDEEVAKALLQYTPSRIVEIATAMIEQATSRESTHYINTLNMVTEGQWLEVEPSAELSGGSYLCISEADLHLTNFQTRELARQLEEISNLEI